MESSLTANGKIKSVVKVVVRLLPPTLSEETFIESLSPDVIKNVTWMKFVKGKRRKTFEKPSTNSRAYLSFPTVEVAEAFCQSFHGHSFVDEKGEVFKAVACFAPYQKVPKKEIPYDKKSNTMETDPLYLQFVQSLTSTEDSTTGQSVKSQEPAPAPALTPLVLAVQERRRQRQTDLGIKKKKKHTKLPTFPQKSGPTIVLLQRKPPQSSGQPTSSESNTVYEPCNRLKKEIVARPLSSSLDGGGKQNIARNEFTPNLGSLSSKRRNRRKKPTNYLVPQQTAPIVEKQNSQLPPPKIQILTRPSSNTITDPAAGSAKPSVSINRLFQHPKRSTKETQSVAASATKSSDKEELIAKNISSTTSRGGRYRVNPKSGIENTRQTVIIDRSRGGTTGWRSPNGGVDASTDSNSIRGRGRTGGFHSKRRQDST